MPTGARTALHSRAANMRSWEIDAARHPFNSVENQSDLFGSTGRTPSVGFPARHGETGSKQNLQIQKGKSN